MPSDELATTLENRSGLTGLPDGDMREVLSAAPPRATRAVLGRTSTCTGCARRSPP